MRKGLQAEIYQGAELSFVRQGERRGRVSAFVLQALLAGGLACVCVQVLAEAAIRAQEGNVQNWIEYYERERAGNPQRSERPSGVTGVPASPEAERPSDPARRQDTPQGSGQAR